MPNIEGQKRWSAVRLLETHELARGGVNGNLNEQAKALADRTEFLMDEKASKAEIVQGVFEFGTYSEFDALKSTLPLNCTVVINEENTTAAGQWGIGNNSWNGSVLKKSAYDPVQKSLVKVTEEFDKIASLYSKNLFNKEDLITDKFLSSTDGSLNNSVGWVCSNFIPVEAGQTYTLSGSRARQGISFFASSSLSVTPALLYERSADMPITITAPEGANFVVIALESATAKGWSNIQFEVGSQATAYEEFGNVYKIKDDVLPNSLVKRDQLDEALSSKLDPQDIPELVEPLLDKEYEVILNSKNLFNEDDLLINYYLSSVNGAIGPLNSWTCSNFIPVEAGQTYTLSGSRARQGISFFNTQNPGINAALLYVATTTMPITVTAPEGANFVVIQLESATAKGWSNIQFEVGNEVTEYMPFNYSEKLIAKSKVVGLDRELERISASLTNIENNIGSQKKASIKLTNGKGFTTSGDLDIGLSVFNSINYDASSVFNFYTDNYKNQLVRRNGDDAAPVRMMSATIGANHGYSRTVLTAANHGKTNSDVGSVWSNGTYEWVIIQIISVNQLTVTCRTLNIALSANSTLTHVSGATNTADLKPTAVSAKQWYPMLKNHKVNLILDNQIKNDANLDSGFNNSLKVSESYDLMEKADIVEWLIQNGGKEVKSYNAVSACNVSHTHTFNTDLTDTISANFFVYKDLSAANDLMFTQSARLQAVNNEVLYYVPRSIAFVHESVTYDFSKPTNVANLTITSRINFDLAKTELSAVLPDRLVMLAGDLGYATGYLPILDAAPDVRNSNTSKGIQISNTEAKVYPYLIDSLTTLQAGANYSCVAYRAYFERPSVAARTVQYDVQHGNEAYLFLDWHAGDFVDIVELKTYLHGRSFEIIEKTENVTLLSKIASENIAVKVGNVTSNARLILKF